MANVRGQAVDHLRVARRAKITAPTTLCRYTPRRRAISVLFSPQLSDSTPYRYSERSYLYRRCGDMNNPTSAHLPLASMTRARIIHMSKAAALAGSALHHRSTTGFAHHEKARENDGAQACALSPLTAPVFRGDRRRAVRHFWMETACLVVAKHHLNQPSKLAMLILSSYPLSYTTSHIDLPTRSAQYLRCCGAHAVTLP